MCGEAGMRVSTSKSEIMVFCKANGGLIPPGWVSGVLSADDLVQG